MEYRKTNFPPIMYWEVTDKCNHNCIHCFNYWRTDKELFPETEHGEEHYLALTGKILENKPVRVIITGGEPLLVFAKIKSSLEMFLKAGVKLSINTNAALINKEMAEYFRNNKIGLFVSFPSVVPDEFDVITDTAGAFNRVVAALDLLQEVGAKFSLNSVISTVNVNSVYKTAEFLKNRYDIRNIFLTRVSEPANSSDEFKKYLLDYENFQNYVSQCARACKELGIEVKAASPITPCSLTEQEGFDLFAFKSGCNAGKSSYTLDSLGNLRACCRDSEIYGNITEEPFSVIWDRLSSWRNEDHIPEECSECECRSSCLGGCRLDGIKLNKRNCLDIYSDPKRKILPVKEAVEYIPSWGFEQAFVLAQNIEFLKEDFGYRISVSGEFEYCTDKLVEYLKAHNEFSVADFSEHFNINLENSKKVLYNLVCKRIIFIKK